MTGGALFYALLYLFYALLHLFYALLHLLFYISALRIIFRLPPFGYFYSVFRPAGRCITAFKQVLTLPLLNLKTILIFLDFSFNS